MKLPKFLTRVVHEVLRLRCTVAAVTYGSLNRRRD
jgi:hypothetical protein